jgi:diguanylate cyclase (GGDEF)-like protein
MTKENIIKYHFFIAHSSSDLNEAIELYNLLSTKGMKVYLDAISLKPGDLWDDKLKEAQSKALVTIVLISVNTCNSFYQKEEIAIAIELSRKLDRIIIPIYLEPIIDQTLIPYGLTRIHSLYITKDCNLLKVSDDLVNLIQSKQKAKIDNEEIRTLDKSESNSKSKLEDMIKEKNKQNIQKFIEKLKEIKQIAYFKKLNASIIFFDIDGMTQINRYHGEKVADEVNAKIQEIFNNTIKGTMTTYKIGTDEYIAASLNCDQEKAVENAKNICLNISSYNWNEIKYELRVSASFGVAQFIRDYQEHELLETTRGVSSISFREGANEWIIRAILGSREAKKKGGNQVVIGPKYLPNHLINDIFNYLS